MAQLVTDLGKIVNENCRARVQEIAAERNGTLLATWANFKYLDFVENWMLHLHKLNVTNYLIGTMDIKLLEVRRTMPLLSVCALHVFLSPFLTVLLPILHGKE